MGGEFIALKEASGPPWLQDDINAFSASDRNNLQILRKDKSPTIVYLKSGSDHN
jgi:hypothetical protein